MLLPSSCSFREDRRLRFEINRTRNEQFGDKRRANNRYGVDRINSLSAGFSVIEGRIRHGRGGDKLRTQKSYIRDGERL